MIGIKLMQARIRARARDFEVPALLDLLAHLGYRREDISYRGYLSARPHPSVVHQVEFFDRDGRARVAITLNLGMLSCRSPLPSYFGELLTDIDTADALRELLELVDHTLLETRCRSYRPERTFAEWQQTKRDMLRLTGLCSPSLVTSLFARVFPELDVAVTRGVGEIPVLVGTTRIGRAALGNCAFGSYINKPSPGVRVTLRAQDVTSYAGVPWRAEATRRLHGYVLPLLRDTGMHLVVELLLLARGKYFHLDGDSSIGYEPLPGGRAGPYRVTLFRGRLVPEGLAAPGSRPATRVG